MKTIVRNVENKDNKEAIREAAGLLREGKLVAFPTETVYGLGGSGWMEEAASRIYEAKGRPSDNPLILHIGSMEMIDEITSCVPGPAKKAMDAFWPGPLTVILPKSDKVPYRVTGGLDSVAVRMPSHPAALALLRETGVPVAAPSANTSGRPSPTKAEHVVEDLDGKIPMVLDGGKVEVGVESTIVDFTGEVPVILRPGKITKDELEKTLLTEVLMSTPSVKEDTVPKAPGMKYKHYAPKAQLILILGEDIEKVVKEITKRVHDCREQGMKTGVIATEETMGDYDADEVISVGSRSHMETVTANLYDVLREFDHIDVDVIFSEGFEGEEYEEAVMNRLAKAAGHQVIRV